jgi:hypothetical protein
MNREKTVRTASSAVVVLLALLQQMSAGMAADEPVAAQQSARPGVPIMVANRPIIVLRGPIAGFSARARDGRRMKRIDDALAAQGAPAVTIEGSGRHHARPGRRQARVSGHPGRH